MKALDALLSPPERRPLVIVNRFTPKQGQMDAFMDMQRAALQRFSGKLQGWRGSRLYKGIEGRTATLVSVFDSLEDYARWRDSNLLAAHRVDILPLIERAEPELYELAYESGTV